MKNKEKKVKEVLKSQKFEIDTDALWNEIKGDLPKRKRKRAMIFWFLPLLFVPFLLIFNFVSPDKQAEGTTALSQNIEADEKKVIAVNNSESTNTELESSIDLIKNSNSDLLVNSSTIISNAEILDVNEKRLLNSGKTSSKTEAKTNSNNIASVESSSLRNIENSGRGKEPKFESVTIANSNLALDAEMRKAKGKLETQRLVAASSVVLNNNQKPNSRFISVSSLTSQIPLVQEAESVFELKQKLKVNEQEALIKSVKVPRWSLGFDIGTNLTHTKVSSQTIDPKLIEKFNERESGMPGWSANFNLSYRLNDRFKIISGLSLDQNVVRYQNSDLEVQNSIQDGVEFVNIDALGVSSNIAGEVEELRYIQNNVQWHRSHIQTDAFVGLRANVFSYRGLKINPMGGIAYNLFSLNSGYAIEVGETLSLEKFENDEGKAYLQNTGLKPFLGLELAFRAARTEWHISVNQKWNINPINTQNQFYQIKNSQTGISLGTRYNLNGN